MLMSPTNAYAGCGKPTLSFIEHLSWDAHCHSDSEATSPHVSQACIQIYMSNWHFSMNVNLKIFCILSLCINILCVTSKASILFWNKVSFCRVFFMSSLSVVWLPWRSKTVEQLNYIRYISKLWCAWGSKWNFWSRGRFKWRCRWWMSPRAVLFCSQPDNATENPSLRRLTFARAQLSGVPLKVLSRVKLRPLTREHIPKNIPQSSKIPDYTHRAHVLRDVSNAFCECTCKHES